MSTTNPVTAGAITPAKLAKQFCNPDHLPAASGPAIVWVIAQWLDAKMPYEKQASIRNAIEATVPGIITTNRITVENVSPVIVHVFRTLVGEIPAAIKRSEIHPANVVDTAV